MYELGCKQLLDDKTSVSTDWKYWATQTYSGKQVKKLKFY